MTYDDWKTETPEDEHCRLYHGRRLFPVERCNHGNPIGNGCCIEECDECEAERREAFEIDEAENRCVEVNDRAEQLDVGAEQ